MSLLRLLSWPYVRKHGTRTVLTVAGIVLGVAVFVAMRTANEGVLRGFAQTIGQIAGKTDLQVTVGEAGFAEERLEQVQALPCVAVAVPAIEAVVESKAAGGGTLLVLAVDMTGDRSLRDYDVEGDEAVDDPLIFLAQPDSLIVSTEFAERHALRSGSTLALDTSSGERNFTVRGIMKASGFASAFGGNLAVMDIYAAQKMFGRGRTFDRIDLAVKEGHTIEQCRQDLQAALGPAFEVQPPAIRGQQAQAMVGGFTNMIQITSAFALFIGMFIIYNSFATAVAQRRTEIGILRALGASRAQVRTLFLAESVLYGIVGSAIGLVVGVALARAIAGSIGTVMSGMYGVAQQAADVATSVPILALSMLAGVIASIAGAFFPARDAARLDPLMALQKGGRDRISSFEYRARLIGGATVGILASLALLWPTARGFYLSYVLMLTGVIVLGPWLTQLLMRGLSPLLRSWRPVEGALAADSVTHAPRRSSATVAALMLSVALIVAFAGIARGAYGSVVDWVDAALNADLFVMPSPRLDIRTMRFPPEMADEIAALPGVARVQRFRNSRITFREQPAMVIALEMQSVNETSRVQPVAGDRSTMYARAAAGDGLLVSDSLAQKHGLALGDHLGVPTPLGSLDLPIVGIVVDYTDQQGSILVDRSVFLKHWQDDGVSDFRVFVAPGADAGAVRQAIVNRFAGIRQVFVLTNDESRRYVIDLAQQWFGLMNLQVAVGVLVAVLGIFNALTVSVSDRKRELGVTRAIGALNGQVRRMIWIEALTLALLGIALGAVVGSINLWYLLEVVRRDVAGVRLAYDFPFGTLLMVVPVLFAAAIAAAIGPAEAAVRTPLTEALEYE